MSFIESIRVECWITSPTKTVTGHSRQDHLKARPTFLAREIVEFEKSKLDRLSARFGGPYRFYVGTKTEFFDFIEQNRALDSLGEDLGRHSLWPLRGKLSRDPADHVFVASAVAMRALASQLLSSDFQG